MEKLCLKIKLLVLAWVHNSDGIIQISKTIADFPGTQGRCNIGEFCSDEPQMAFQRDEKCLRNEYPSV